MGRPSKTCGNCRYYRRGRPPGTATWTKHYGSCQRREGHPTFETVPVHANYRACEEWQAPEPPEGKP